MAESGSKAKIMREADVRPASAQMKFARTMPIAATSFRTVGAGRAANRLNQAEPPACAAAARSGLAITKDAAIMNPKTSDQNTEWSMPRGTARRASRVSSDVWADASKPVIV